jgi:hypothetical protein
MKIQSRKQGKKDRRRAVQLSNFAESVVRRSTAQQQEFFATPRSSVCAPNARPEAVNAHGDSNLFRVSLSHR